MNAADLKETVDLAIDRARDGGVGRAQIACVLLRIASRIVRALDKATTADD